MNIISQENKKAAAEVPDFLRETGKYAHPLWEQFKWYLSQLGYPEEVILKDPELYDLRQDVQGFEDRHPVFRSIDPDPMKTLTTSDGNSVPAFVSGENSPDANNVDSPAKEELTKIFHSIMHLVIADALKSSNQSTFREWYNTTKEWDELLKRSEEILINKANEVQQNPTTEAENG